MVANMLQITLQDKIQSKKAKVKKNTNFATLLNDKIEKKQRISNENKEILSKKIQNQKDKKDVRFEFTQKTSKAKKSKFEQTQTISQELALIPADQTFALKESLPHKDQAKKLKSSKKITPPQSTQEQLALHTFKKAHSKKSLTPLKEALQTPLQSQNHEQKTLGDIVKLAEGLNLAKLQLKEEKPQKQEKTPQLNKEEIPNLANKTNQTSLLQTLLTKEKAKTQKTQEISKSEYKYIDKRGDIPQSQELPKELKLRDIGLNDLLKIASKEKLETSEEKIIQEEKKSEKTQDFSLNELKRETQFKIASSKEMLTQFSQRIKEEVLNYKPPFTKLSMELNPAELGKLEITITKKGKELQINVNANNAHALQTFLQNQNEFRATLSNAGFNNVELNFSQGEGRGSGSRSQEQEQQKRNKNSLEEAITEIPALASMEIKMVQYA